MYMKIVVIYSNTNNAISPLSRDPLFEYCYLHVFS